MYTPGIRFQTVYHSYGNIIRIVKLIYIQLMCIYIYILCLTINFNRQYLIAHITFFYFFKHPSFRNDSLLLFFFP